MFTFDKSSSLSKLKWMFEEQQRLLHFGMWEWDIPQKLLYWSEEACRILGVCPDGPISETTAKLFLHPDERENAKQALQAALKEREPFSLNYRIVRGDGEVRYIQGHCSANYDECGQPMRVFGTMQDITRQRETEETLKITEANLKTLFEKSHIGIIVSDINGRIQRSNPAAERLLGYAQGELMRMHFSELTRADDLEIEMPWVCELKDGKRGHYVTEKRYIRKDGEIIWVRITGMMIQGPQNEPQGIVLAEDISARKQGEDQIKRQNAMLRAINRIHEQSLAYRSSDELIDACMEIVEEVTASPVVYIGEEDRGHGSVRIGLPVRQRCRVRCEAGRTCMRSRFPDSGFIVDIMRTAKPLRTNVPVSRQYMRYPHIVASLGVPFIQEGQVTGVLAVANRPGGYTPEQQELLESLAPAIFLSLLKKRGEEAARENEQLMRAIMDSASDFLFVKDRESRVVMVNQAYGRVFGVDIGDVIGKNDYELYSDPEMARGVIENDRHVMRTGKTLVCQEAAMTVNGFRTFQLSKVPWKDTKGRVMGILGIAHDVTELKNAKDSLEQTVASVQHSKEVIDILYETTEKLLSTLTPREEIAALCGRVMRFLDCHVFFNYLTEGNGEIMHLNACGGISQQQRDELEYLPIGAAVCGCAVRDKCRIVAEYIQISHDPRTELVKSLGIRAYACYPLMMRGKALGSLSFGTRSRDCFSDEELMLMKTVSESAAVAISRKQNEETLIRQAEELKTADRYKNQFLSTLSHELRNPLATISMGLSLLEATQNRKQQDKAIEIMERQIGQLGHLVDDLLNLTRITQNRIMLRKERLELSSLAFAIAEDYHAQFEEKNIHLDCGIPHRAIYVEADPVRVKQIVSNVVQNALKFTDTGGAVMLSVNAENGSAFIRVKDTGRGIDPAFLKIIFEPFMQADDSIDRKNGGLGLGLSIVKGIAELHGGSVSAASAGRGKGSEFTIRLPMPRQDCGEEAGW